MYVEGREKGKEEKADVGKVLIISEFRWSVYRTFFLKTLMHIAKFKMISQTQRYKGIQWRETLQKRLIITPLILKCKRYKHYHFWRPVILWDVPSLGLSSLLWLDSGNAFWVRISQNWYVFWCFTPRGTYSQLFLFIGDVTDYLCKVVFARLLNSLKLLFLFRLNKAFVGRNLTTL